LPLIETEANCECENSHITNLKHANLLPLLRVNLLMFICTSTVWVKKNPPLGDLTFFHFFHKWLRIC